MTPAFHVLGVRISALPLASTRDEVIAQARTGHPGLVCCCDVNSLCSAHRDPAHRQRLNAATLVTPDGMPLVWLGRRQGHAGVERVYGPDLLLAIAGATAGTDLGHYFCGGGPGIASLLAATLRSRYPGLVIAGTETPPFAEPTADSVAAIAARIRAARPAFIWIGVSTPRQEALMAALRPHLESGVLIGVGAAFDLLSGRVRQAPRAIRRLGFEWLWRVAHEPRRLGPRYLRNGPLFLALLAGQLTGLRTVPSPDATAPR